MQRFRLINVLTILIILAMVLVTYTPALAASSATIDFEGLTEGSIVNSVSSGNGISGDPVSGFVSIFGFNPRIAPANAAMIFDSDCDGGCTGGDDDLFFQLGNILIVSEDGDGADPNDSDDPKQYITFDFSTFGPGSVTVESLIVGDIEAEESGGFVVLFDGATSLGTVPLPTTGDANFTTLNIGFSGVTSMVVDFAGSAAVDNIKLSVEEPSDGDQGCTPGYWKNHLDAWAPTSFSTNQTLESVFDVPDSLGLDNATLLQALNFGGGPGVVGGAEILFRAAVAALLNASHPDVSYPMTTAEVISEVNAALASLDRGEMLDLADILDANNNLGCPLD